jgi:putative transposase
MARPKIKRKGVDWKELVSADKDLVKSAVQEIVQEILEAEMEEIVGARKSERSAERTGYGSGYYTRGLITRVGKLDGVGKSAARTGSGRFESLPTQSRILQHLFPS